MIISTPAASKIFRVSLFNDAPATKAVLDTHLKDFSTNPQVDIARALTLKQLQSFVADQFTDEVLAKIDADLAKIAPPK